MNVEKRHALVRYAKDPVAYAHEWLGVKALTPDQTAVLRYLAAHPRCRLLVPSANETGKSFLAAIIASWHYDCFLPTMTICTAPSKEQIKDIVFRELRRLRRNDPNFVPKDTKLMESVDRMCLGVTAKEGSAFQGKHDSSVLVIFDEAEAIEHDFWEATESFAHRWVAFYNPTKAISAAAVAERERINGKPTWKVIRMSALNHPNVTEALAGRMPPIPNAVTLEKVLERLSKWGSELRPGDPPAAHDIEVAGRIFRPGPVAEARVLGVRPSKPVDAVYNRATLDLLESTSLEVKPFYPVQVGCDVARFGDDMSVFHVRKGPVSLHHEAVNGWNTTQIAARLRELCVKYGGDHPIDVPVIVDSVGMGVGVLDQAKGFNFLGLNSSRPSDLPEDYPNLRSQLYFDFEEILKNNLVDMHAISPAARHDISEQLQAACYTLDTKGRRVVWPKEKIKDILGRSPDDADAVLLAYYQYPETLETYQ